MKTYYVYLLTSQRGTLYTGMTNNLHRRVYEHKNKTKQEFTAKYNIDKLVHIETFHDVRDAIAREKQIKGWVRRKKIALIETHNPKWQDLSDGWYDE